MSNTPSHNPDPGSRKYDPAERLALLADAYLHGELSPEGLAELEAMIQADPANAERFIAVTEQAGMMREVFTNVTDPLEAVEDHDTDDFLSILSELDAPGGEPPAPIDLTAELARREMEAKERERNRRRLSMPRHATPEQYRPVVISKPLAWLGIAAVLGLLASVVWFNLPVKTTPAVSPPPTVERPTESQPSPTHPSGLVQVATVTGSLDARLADGTWVVPGMRVWAQPLDLAEGVVEVTMTSGVTLTIEGPAVVAPASDMYVNLERGKLVGRVPERGQGFTVHANNADIVDLGTEFAVDVTGQQTHVQVYDGEVVVASPDSAFTSRAMLEGDAGVVVRGQVHQTPFEEFAFLREVPSAYELMVRDLDPLVWWSFSRDDDGRLADRGRAGVHVGDATGWRVTEALHREAFSIDGSQRPIAIPDTGVFNKTNNFTIEAWVRVGFEIKPSSRIVSTMPDDGGRYGFGFGFVGQTFAAEYLCRTADGRFFRSSPLSVKFSWFGMYDLVTERPIPEGEWVQVVVVCSSEHPVRLYVNGEPQRAGVVHGMAPPDANLGQTPHQVWTGANAGYASAQSPTVGGNPHDGEPEPFIGDLDELVFYDKPLTDEEVLSLYEAALASVTAPNPAGARAGRSVR